MTKRTKLSAYSANNRGIQAENVQAKAMAVGKGAKAVVTENAPVEKDEIKVIFEMLRQKANLLRDEAERQDAHTALDVLEKEARGEEKTKEKTTQKWLNFLMETSPDIWDVAIDTFTNPIKGVSTVFRKVAERAKANRATKDNN